MFLVILFPSLMSISPRSWLGDKPLDLRAPPPSPIATGRRSSFTNESVLADFLRSSLKVPELVLPDSVVPRQKIVETPARIDLKSFYSSESDVLVSEVIKHVYRIGFFELINHGISNDLIKEVTDEAGKIFDLSWKEKGSLRKSVEKIYGFDERNGVEEEEIMGEEFVWGRDEELVLKLEAVLPRAYSNFSAKMETLSASIEQVASKILQRLEKHNEWTTHDKDKAQASDSLKSVCCIHKHNNLIDMTLAEWARTLRYDAIRMLIRRGSDYSHALGIHVCDGCSEFHIYSKKGWVSFVPQKSALVITLGDQIQAWSGGVQKHVIGKPVFKGDNSNHEEKMRDNISMAFLFSPPHSTKNLKPWHGDEDEFIITLGQQLHFAILLTLAFQLLSFICSFL